MLSAGTCTTWNRSGIALCGVLAALALATPASAAGTTGGATDSDGAAAYGGSMYFAPPTIASLRCKSA